jgi:hypothetical protein
VRHFWRSESDADEYAWESDAALAEAWWAEEPAKENDLSERPAHEYVEEQLLDRGSATFVEVVATIVASASDDDALAYVGAGLLEDAVRHERWARSHAAGIEQRARQDERFRQAVTAIWLGEGTDPEVLARLVPLGATDITKPRPEAAG